MAKKKKKKAASHRKNPKRVAAAKKAYRKMKREGRGIAAKHKGYSKKKSSHGKSKAKTYAAKQRKQQVVGMKEYEKLKVKALMKGMSPAAAEAYAAKALGRLHRAQSAARGRGVAEVQRRHEAEAAAKQWAAFGDVFRKIGKEEQRRASL